MRDILFDTRTLSNLKSMRGCSYLHLTIHVVSIVTIDINLILMKRAKREMKQVHQQYVMLDEMLDCAFVQSLAQEIMSSAINWKGETVTPI